jgi:molecular chaperone IbpA
LNGPQANFPPYDIARLSEDTYRITLAVPGFSPNEIGITAQQNLLSVAGQKREADEQQYLHRSIMAQSFDKQFNLADHVEVSNATLENGLLQVELIRKIPEAMKPRRIHINGSKPKIVGETKSA